MGTHNETADAMHPVMLDLLSDALGFPYLPQTPDGASLSRYELVEHALAALRTARGAVT